MEHAEPGGAIASLPLAPFTPPPRSGQPAQAAPPVVTEPGKAFESPDPAKNYSLGPGRSADLQSEATETATSPPAPDPGAAGPTMPTGIVAGGDAVLRVRLEPPELGTVDVRLRVSDGSVVIVLTLAGEAAQSLVAAQLPALRSRLEAAGIKVGRLDVESGQAGPGRQDSRPEPGPHRAQAATTTPRPAVLTARHVDVTV